MSRSIWILAITLLSIATTFSLAAPREYSPASQRDLDESGEMGWILVTDGATSMSDLADQESIEELRVRFGSPFLVLHQGNARFVVRDRGLIDRAERAVYAIKVYGKETAMLATFQARGALGSAKRARKASALAKRPAPGGSRGDSDDRLQREFEALIHEMEVLEASSRRGEVSGETHELDLRSKALSRRLQQAVRGGRREMRQIFDDAKERHLLQPLPEGMAR